MFTLVLSRHALLHHLHTRKDVKGIRALQKQKLRKLVQYAYDYSPYYRQMMQKRNLTPETAQLSDFPILTKSQVIDHFDQLVTDRRLSKKRVSAFLAKSKNPTDLLLDSYVVIHTSGSSGQIGYYVYRADEFATGLAPATQTGMRIFQRLAYVAATKGHFAGVTMASFAQKVPFLYSSVELFDINDPFANIIKKLNAYQPTTLVGYAFALGKLAEAQKKGMLSIHPRVIESGGEVLTSRDRRYIQKTFNTEVVNVYASSEHLIMGIGIPEWNGMYLMDDNLIFEPRARDTLVTNLFNYTLPLIRYRMADRLTVQSDKTNRFPFTKIHEIVGRNEHVPVFENENGTKDFISPVALAELYVKNLERYQIHILGKRRFTFYAKLSPALSKKKKKETIVAIEKELKNLLAQKKMGNVLFTVTLTDDLQADKKTGKFRLIVK